MIIHDLMKKSKIIGGPVEALADFMVDMVPGMYVIDHALTATEGGIKAVFSAATDTDDDRDTLPPLPRGYTVMSQEVNRLSPHEKFVEAALEFAWMLYEGVYVPAHWLEAGVERCIAMHRILGPDETKWPALERAA